MKTYQPQPIDTSGITVDAGVLDLIELMARNAHDIWAQKRIEDGWQFGAVRNDARKEHPCLVPYNELPESEKDYDRAMALETLKVILSLGYRLQK